MTRRANGLMHLVAKKGNQYLILLERGEELFESLMRFSRQNRIRGAWFSAFGGAEEIEIGYFDLKKKKYFRRRFRGPFEILGITGNIALRPIRAAQGRPEEFEGRQSSGQARKGKEFVFHAHGAFGKTNYSVIGGHIFRAVTGGTCEILVQKLPRLKRAPDSRTGLSLLV